MGEYCIETNWQGEVVTMYREFDKTVGIEQINQLMAASKVAQRDPDTMKTFVDSVLADSPAQNIFIDAQSFAQSGVADKVAAALPEVAKQLPEALATGGEIRIPVSDYVTRIAPTELAQPLVDHIRLDGEEFSRAGAREYMSNHGEEIQAEVERVLTRQAEDENFQASTLTDERMLQNYGDLATPDAIQRAADMAIHNEVRARFITTEANALAKATGSLRMLGTAAKEFAEARPP